MKTSEILKKLGKSLSFEFFPLKDEDGFNPPRSRARGIFFGCLTKETSLLQ